LYEEADGDAVECLCLAILEELAVRERLQFCLRFERSNDAVTLFQQDWVVKFEATKLG
jgi:hypothetical protein